MNIDIVWFSYGLGLFMGAANQSRALAWTVSALFLGMALFNSLRGEE